MSDRGKLKTLLITIGVVALYVSVTVVVFELYLEFWVLFVGGILNVHNAVKSDPINFVSIAWGASKIILALLTVVGLALVLVLPGFLKRFLKHKDDPPSLN